MMSKDIGIGVIGLGFGQTLFPLNNISGSRFIVKAACGVESEESVSGILKKWDVDFFTNDYKELVKNKNIDVVGIFTPDDLHYEHCIAALEAGKHIICTKPLTDKVETAIEIAKLAKKNKLKVLVGQTLRFEPQSIALKKFLDDGDLGRVIFTEAHYVQDMRQVLIRTPWRLKKKWLLGAGCHPIDAVRWIAGDISKIQAFGNQGKISAYPSYDNYTINIEFENGAIGRVLLLVGIVQPPEPQMKISIYGSKGSGYSYSTEGIDSQVKVVFDKINKMPLFTASFEPETPIDAGVYSSHTRNVLRFMEHFEDCIINDRQPSPNASDAVKTLIAANAAQQSIDTGKVVKVSNKF
jgi:predicted dehydrogenase